MSVLSAPSPDLENALLPISRALLLRIETDWPADQIAAVDPERFLTIPPLARLKAQGYEFRWAQTCQVRALAQTGWVPAIIGPEVKPTLFVSERQKLILLGRKPTDPVQKFKIE